MTTALLVAVLLARQNPYSPCVDLPPGWATKYFPNNDHRVALLVGPDGERIAFPAYPGTRSMNFTSPSDGASGEEIAFLKYEDSGKFAEVIHQRNPKRFFVTAWLGGRQVEAAISENGILAVSLAERKGGKYGSDLCVDFTTKVTTARQTATALGIILTRLDYNDRENSTRPKPEHEPDGAPVIAKLPGDPFPGSICVPEGYAYRSSKAKSVVGRFERSGAITLEMRRVRAPKAGTDLKGESLTVLGGKVNVRSKDGVRVSADYEPREGRSGESFISFVSKSRTPSAAVAVIFAALTYLPKSIP